MQNLSEVLFLHLASNILTLQTVPLMEIMLKKEDLSFMEYFQITKYILLM